MGFYQTFSLYIALSSVSSAFITQLMGIISVPFSYLRINEWMHTLFQAQNKYSIEVIIKTNMCKIQYKIVMKLTFSINTFWVLFCAYHCLIFMWTTVKNLWEKGTKSIYTTKIISAFFSSLYSLSVCLSLSVFFSKYVHSFHFQKKKSRKLNF